MRKNSNNKVSLTFNVSLRCSERNQVPKWNLLAPLFSGGAVSGWQQGWWSLGSLRMLPHSYK
jgi:hypothetical protein